VEIVETTKKQIADPEIRDRDATSSRCAYTRHFLATEAGSEIGLLSVDLPPTEEPFVIYEIFVPTVMRRRGFGGRLLQAAEEMARSLGYKSALLVPKSLDKAFPQRALEEWHAKNGYIPLDNSANGAVVKELEG
jgi:GNAT superfamily N-acetyltransferase